MNIAYLLTGGNIGDRLAHLQAAKTAIEKDCGIITNASDIYETEAWGGIDQSPFLNQALELQTHLSATELLHCLLKIEQHMGRERIIKYGPRIIDIDILFFNMDIIDTNELKVPHPQMQHRRFVLQCLNDIAPLYMHPVLKKTVAQLLAECTDKLNVHKI